MVAFVWGQHYFTQIRLGTDRAKNLEQRQIRANNFHKNENFGIKNYRAKPKFHRVLERILSDMKKQQNPSAYLTRSSSHKSNFNNVTSELRKGNLIFMKINVFQNSFALKKKLKIFFPK